MLKLYPKKFPGRISEKENTMKFLIGFLVGLIVGLAVLFVYSRVIRRSKLPIGDLRIDRSDPNDAPLLFLELDEGTNVYTIMRNKYAVFRVKLKNYLPHE